MNPTLKGILIAISIIVALFFLSRTIYFYNPSFSHPDFCNEKGFKYYMSISRATIGPSDGVKCFNLVAENCSLKEDCKSFVIEEVNQYHKEHRKFWP